MENRKQNSSQLKAIRHGKGPLLIIAGAGTGKTTVITERIKFLISQKKVKPENILALTFTEKAAAEMVSRLDVVMPLGYEEPWIMTFHSFCDRILRDEGLEIGLSTDYKILDTPNQWILFKKNLFKFGFTYYLPLGNPTKFIAAVLKFFSRLQDEDINVKDLLIYIKNLQLKSKIKNQKSKISENEDNKRLLELANAYKKYQEIKLIENFLDFGDLILWTLKLFRQRPAILKKYQLQFRHILVDEFQDTNWAQLQLVKLLAPAKNNPNLIVVGDDDQSIYKWRGAAVSNILDFKEHYPKACEVVLTKNYRSGQKLLDCAYKLITNNNPDRLEVKLGIDKKLEAVRGSKLAPAQIFQLETVEEEADFVSGKILELLAKGDYTYKDFAILGRANNHLEPFVQSLKRNGIPYQLVGNRGLFDQDEIRDLIFFARSVVDPFNSANLFQVMHNSLFGISAKELLMLLMQGRAVRKSLWELISEKNEPEIEFLKKVITEGQKQLPKGKTSKILLDFIGETGFLKQFTSKETLENQLKLKNLNLFFNKIKRFETDNKEAGILEFVDWLDLLIEAGENPAQAEIEDIDTVSLITVHGAKGLEFNVCFVVNCVADRFPTRKRGDPIDFPDKLIKESLPEGDSHLEEERRLFYVAATRARDFLFFTLAKDYGGSREKRPSVFLNELNLAIQPGKLGSAQMSFLGLAPIIVKPRKIIEGKFALAYISYSQIDTFLACPLKYKYRYLLQVPTRPHHALTFGSTIHSTLRDFHLAQLRGYRPDIKTLLGFYTKHFDETGYDSEEHKKKRRLAGEKMLQGYFNVYKEKLPGKPLFLEKKFRLRIADIPLIGKIDRIDKVGEAFELIDYKTGSARDQKKVDADRQLTVYAMAARNALNIDPQTLSLYFIETNDKISTARGSEQIKEEKEKIKEVIDKIKNSKFEATSGYPYPCKYCDYNQICPFAKKS